MRAEIMAKKRALPFLSLSRTWGVKGCLRGAWAVDEAPDPDGEVCRDAGVEVGVKLVDPVHVEPLGGASGARVVPGHDAVLPENLDHLDVLVCSGETEEEKGERGRAKDERVLQWARRQVLSLSVCMPPAAPRCGD